MNSSFLLGIRYSSAVVESEDETLVYDAGNFLTAAGGYLGLCLGFSCLSLLIGIFNLARRFFANQFFSK